MPYIKVYLRNKLILEESPNEGTEKRIDDIISGAPTKKNEEFNRVISPSPLLIEYTKDSDKN